MNKVLRGHFAGSVSGLFPAGAGRVWRRAIGGQPSFEAIGSRHGTGAVGCDVQQRLHLGHCRAGISSRSQVGALFQQPADKPAVPVHHVSCGAHHPAPGGQLLAGLGGGAATETVLQVRLPCAIAALRRARPGRPAAMQAAARLVVHGRLAAGAA